MHFQLSDLQLRLLQKLILVMLLLLLVSGDQTEESVVGMNGHSPGAEEKQPVKQQHQRLRHSFDGVFFSSKRRVPNASDPLHNR